MHKKILTSLAALLALAVCMALPALASASPVLTDEGKALGTKTKIVGTNTAPILFKAGETTVTCTVSTLTGEVTENSGSSIKGTITSASYTNAGGARCTSTNLGEITVTTEIAKTDWCISSTGGDAFSLQAGACGSASVALKFTLDTTFGFTCVYTRAAGNPVTGTYTTGSDVLKIGEGAASSFTSTSFGCPSSGSLVGSYTLETDGTTTPITIS